MLTVQNTRKPVATVAKTKQCPLCLRMFPGKAALAQHRLDVHAGATGQILGRNGAGILNVNTAGRKRNRKNLVSQLNNLSIPRTNYDNTARFPGQAVEEATFGSSATERINTRGPTGQGIQEAVAQVIGSTPEGRAWALAALHPCGAGEVVARNVGAVNGMSDTMTGSVATPVYRAEEHVTYSPALFNVEIKTPTTYGIDFIIPPIPEIDFVYRLIDDSQNVKTDWIVVRQPDFELPPPKEYSAGGHGYDTSSTGITFSSAGYGKTRQIAVGHTFELDAAGLNDQGRVVVGQMEGQWTWIPLSAPTTDVKTSSFVTKVEPVATAPAVTSVHVSGADATNGCWSLYVPTEPASIVSNCPNAYQGLAKHGAYVVSKFTSPLLGYAFKRTGVNTVFESGSASGDYADMRPFLPATSLAIQSDTTKPFTLGQSDGFWSRDVKDVKHWSAFGDKITNLEAGSSDNPVNQQTFHPFVSEPSDMTTAVIMFRNLPAGTLASNSITASVRIKSRNYFECISNGTNAAVAPYVHPPANYDMQALTSVIMAGKQLADAYPACENSLGSILGKIWGVIKGVVHPIAKVVGGIGIPFVSPAANLVDEIIGSGVKYSRNYY